MEIWLEIFQSIRKHKLRTFLTGFGVAWGIFMLVILLSAGKGFQNGIFHQFSGIANNSIEIWGGRTSLPYKGLSTQRIITTNSQDLDLMKVNIPEIKYVTPIVELPTDFIYYNDKSGTYQVSAIYPEYTKIKYVHIGIGREIDPIDFNQKRKVAVVGRKVIKQLFMGKPPLGEYLSIKGNYFMVIGVMEADSTKIDVSSEDETILIPYSTYKETFNPDGKIRHFKVVAQEGVSTKDVEKKIIKYLAEKCKFDENDDNAVWIQNTAEFKKGIGSLFAGMNIFLWIIGISTLIGGVVGVGNIMLVTVKERTKEIGIRKALGAMPSSILRLIIQESIVITTSSGIIGLLAATGILLVIGHFTKSVAYFQHPEVDLRTAGLAILVLIISGALAGYIPARNASKVSPIEALRYE